jgi:hypothetical protein
MEVENGKFNIQYSRVKRQMEVESEKFKIQYSRVKRQIAKVAGPQTRAGTARQLISLLF